jgi:GH24 family phage-related lysozyme (muramidase)
MTDTGMLPVLRGSESSGASGRKMERTELARTINAEEVARREAEIVLAWNGPGGGSETTAKLPWGRRRRRRAANRAMAKLPWT